MIIQKWLTFDWSTLYWASGTFEPISQIHLSPTLHIYVKVIKFIFFC